MDMTWHTVTGSSRYRPTQRLPVASMTASSSSHSGTASAEKSYPLDDEILHAKLVLTRDVVLDGVTYLTSGSDLEPRTVARLINLGIEEVFAKPKIADTVKQAATRLDAMFDATRAVVFAEGVKSTRDAMEVLKRKGRLDLQPFKEEIGGLLEEIMDHYTEFAAESIKELSEHDEPTVVHGVETALFCVELAKAMQWPKARVIQAGLSGMLHDVGKAAVSKDILNHRGPLNQAQREEVERHPLIGYLMLSNNEELHDISAFCAGAHHESFKPDSRGYGILSDYTELKGDPSQLYSPQEQEIAQLVCIADVFSALREGYSLKGPASPLETLIEMNRMATGGRFNPQLYKAWYKQFKRKHRLLLQKGLMIAMPAQLEGTLQLPSGEILSVPEQELRISFEEIGKLQILPKLLAIGCKLPELKRRNGITGHLLDLAGIHLDTGQLHEMGVQVEKPVHYNLVLVDTDHVDRVQCLVMKHGDTLKDLQIALGKKRLDPIQKQLLELRNIPIDFKPLIACPI
ncbi:HD-GYP domain-containing protein [Magnetococcus sp. PR-3]|uniref:HD-GYP domain-containing protein n=1 Tax=Magnetococcus sp. PR-3 TaxID=3120355 RepID=UPI002FCE67F5